MLRLYLDNCSLNRPYDDQSFLKIRLEEGFDYTSWQEDLFSGMTAENIAAQAAEYRRRQS